MSSGHLDLILRICFSWLLFFLRYTATSFGAVLDMVTDRYVFE